MTELETRQEGKKQSGIFMRNRREKIVLSRDNTKKHKVHDRQT